VKAIAKVLPHPLNELPIIIVRRRDQCGTTYNFTVNKERVYKALKYKIEHDKLYRDVKINEDVLKDLPSNNDTNVFNILNSVHMEFDYDINEYIVIGPTIEMDEGNVIDHTTSMASKPPNAPREMELIRAWVNNPNAEPGTLID